MQYGFDLNMGRIGTTLSITRLDESGSQVYTWAAWFNSKGLRVIREGKDGNSVTLCDFSTLLYPDNVEEEELQLVDLLSGAPVKEDHDVIRLCSFLIAKWAAGHDEESFYDVIRTTLKKWSNAVQIDNMPM